jgi:hypothetical protein
LSGFWTTKKKKMIAILESREGRHSLTLYSKDRQAFEAAVALVMESDFYTEDEARMLLRSRDCVEEGEWSIRILNAKFAACEEPPDFQAVSDHAIDQRVAAFLGQEGDPLPYSTDVGLIIGAVDTLRKLSGPEWYDYQRWLTTICGSTMNCIQAGARARAIALVLTSASQQSGLLSGAQEQETSDEIEMLVEMLFNR